MTIPDFQSIMLPLLEYAGDSKEHSTQSSYDYISYHFSLCEEERKDLLPSGTQATIENRVGWAKAYLTKSGLLEKTKRSYFKITNKGLEVLKERPDKINIAYLERFPEFKKFRSIKKQDKEEFTSTRDNLTPLENLEKSFQTINANLSSELLRVVKDSSPKFFEKLVIDLLLKMGYGGTRKDAAEAIGAISDEGIDGIIKEDKLGLDIIYIQAKKWESVVSRPEIQKFVGALEGKRAKKGIFITTSNYSKEAKEYVKNISTKIILIDGEQLADYMINYEIGVSEVTIYEIKKVDTDYFIEE
ncbi:Mrr restriction system protein [subsurface metagenome]